jgi:hypothetical protein
VPKIGTRGVSAGAGRTADGPHAFTEAEHLALMACGYQMADHVIARDPAGEGRLAGAWGCYPGWPFLETLEEVTSVDSSTPMRARLLDELKAGRKRKILT